MKSIVESINRIKTYDGVYSDQEGIIIGDPFKFKDWDKYADKYEKFAFREYELDWTDNDKEDLESDCEPDSYVCLFLIDDAGETPSLAWYLYGEPGVTKLD